MNQTMIIVFFVRVLLITIQTSVFTVLAMLTNKAKELKLRNWHIVLYCVYIIVVCSWGFTFYELWESYVLTPKVRYFYA